MKKKIIITIIVLLILATGCYFSYQYFTKEPTPEPPKEEKPPVEITEELKGKFSNTSLRVDASLATQPLMNAYIKYFTNDEFLEKVKENYTNTHPGYVKLINGETDLIVVTEPSEEELQLAKDKGVELEVTKVVNEGFVFYVNAKNPIDNLSLNQIVDIYSGKINNWNEVGGNNNDIIPYQRPTNSGSQTGMLSLVMKDVPLRKPTTTELIETMGGIIDTVANYDNNIDGLGYSYYYYANIMYHTPNIKFLGINGVKPTYETIEDETYPLMTAYYIVTKKDATDMVLRFKEALLSSEGAKIAREAGYVPIKQKK